MEYSKAAYIEFISEGYRCLIALPWVKDVRKNGEWGQNLPVLDCEMLMGTTAGMEEQRYGILLEYQNIQFGIAAEAVVGIREIEETQQLELRAPVRNKKNRFISAAVDLSEDGEFEALETHRDRMGGNLAYILDPAVLLECVYIDAG